MDLETPDLQLTATASLRLPEVYPASAWRQSQPFPQRGEVVRIFSVHHATIPTAGAGDEPRIPRRLLRIAFGR